MRVANDIQALIKDIRARLELTQGELSSLLKVSLPTISRWETGRTRLFSARSR